MDKTYTILTILFMLWLCICVTKWTNYNPDLHVTVQPTQQQVNIAIKEMLPKISKEQLSLEDLK
jgi:hypothetical protein